jgi:hypothetical protein
MKRGVLAALLALFLAAQMAYMAWHADAYPEQYEAALRDPAGWDGREVVITLWEIAEVRDANHYVLRKTGRTVLIEGDTTGLARRMDLDVGGTFRAADGAIVESWHEVHPLRDGKRILGLIAIAFVVLTAPLWFTVRDGFVVERTWCPIR